VALVSLHLGRSWWPQHHIEDDCECPKAPCGLVDADTALPDCPEHGWKAAKTMREIHRAELCAAKLEALGMNR
jgi:hypothetical protein